MRSIGDIVESALSSHPTTSLGMARTFFERLWWHDQVVFDVSREAQQAADKSVLSMNVAVGLHSCCSEVKIQD
jgi:transketolase